MKNVFLLAAVVLIMGILAFALFQEGMVSSVKDVFSVDYISAIAIISLLFAIIFAGAGLSAMPSVK